MDQVFLLGWIGVFPFGMVVGVSMGVSPLPSWAIAKDEHPGEILVVHTDEEEVCTRRSI